MLSGGEKRRVQLLSVLSKKPNVLILDEPSNDIDLNTLTALETYLADWNGVLLVVSHDRFFTDKVTNHLFVFEGDGAVLDYAGSLSEYADCLLDNENAAGNNGGIGDSVDSTAKKEAYKEDKDIRNERRNAIRDMKKEMKNIENSLEKLKPKATDIQNEIDNSSDEGWTVLAELTEKLDVVNEQIDEKELRWLELAEALEQSAAEELV
jgi:ATP-binding cassette subfamily F protein uup